MTVAMVIYVLPPVNFTSGVGYVTFRSIDLSNSNSSSGFTHTTLAAAITSGAQSTISVTSSTGYPSPPFVVTVAGATAGSLNEAMDVTAVNGNSWTVTRAYGGTTAGTAYPNGANVSGPVSASVQFVPASTTAIQAIVIDFCTDSPLYNSSSCVTPTGMSIGASGSSVLSIGTITGLTTPTALYNSPYTYSIANNTSRNDLIIQNQSGSGSTLATTGSIATINNSQTSITVTNYASYPTAVTGSPNTYFYINIPSTGETMQVTNTSSGTWTVTRGALSTTPTATSGSVAISQAPIAFTVYGITNPSSAGALYARIYTFSNYSQAASFASAQATAGVLGSPGVPYSSVATYNIDGGGVALYITTSLTITAKVQEYLQFCIYTASGTSSNSGCNLTGSSINLGNPSTGILSISNAYVDSETRFDVATNATGYAAVTFTGTPLSSGSLIIENSTLSGTGSVATTGYASAVGTDQFGLCVNTLTAENGTFSTNSLSFPNATYNSTGSPAACPTAYSVSAAYSGSSAYFGFNIAQAGSVYGDLLALQKPGAEESGVISFLGNIAPSQLAGIYTTTLNFVATGTY